MRTDRLAGMLKNAIAFDCETHLIQPGLLAPPLVCASVATWDPREFNAGTDDDPIWNYAGRPMGQLLDADAARAWFVHLLESDETTIVGANIAFDMLVMAADLARRGTDVMPLMMRAYEAGRVFDLQIAEALHHVSTGHLGKDPRTSSDPRQASPLKDPETGKQGRYSLAIVTDLVLGRGNAKANDRFRQSYALLEGVPLVDWPAEARIYPVDDACNTLEVALAQAGHLARPAPHRWPARGGNCLECGIAVQLSGMPPCRPRAHANANLGNLDAQVFAALAMHLGAAWGFRVDPEAVDALERRVVAVRATELQGFLDAGLLKYKREPNHNLSATETTVARAIVGTGKVKPAATIAEASTRTGLDEATVRETVAALAGRGVLVPSKSTSTIKRRVAIAYGCTTPCRGCAGSGKVPSTKTQNLVACLECGGTGLDLSTAPVPRTETEGVGTGRDTLTESGDEKLIDFAAFSEEAKILETYVPFLRRGLDESGRPRPITLRPNVLLDTGRASYSDVVQQLPRGGGVRECIVARPGYVLCSCDYGGLELVTHAQSCLWLVGRSKLAEALNRELKVHDALGATMIGENYEAFVAKVKAGDKHAKNVRQAAKPANFGFPGGMGPAKLVLAQRKQGPDTTGPDGRVYKGLRFCVLIGGEAECGVRKVTEWKRQAITPTCLRCIECADDIRSKWLLQWPENDQYFDIVKGVVDNGQQIRLADGSIVNLEPGQAMQHRSGRIRGGLERNACANGFFQGLAADGAKLALCRVAQEQYDHTYRMADGRRSPLFGTRTILFAHDELVVEMRDDVAHEAASRLSDVMVESMRVYTPDVRVEAPPALMRRWFKSAEPTYKDGILIPWEPKQ